MGFNWLWSTAQQSKKRQRARYALSLSRPPLPATYRIEEGERGVYQGSDRQRARRAEKSLALKTLSNSKAKGADEKDRGEARATESFSKRDYSRLRREESDVEKSVEGGQVAKGFLCSR